MDQTQQQLTSDAQKLVSVLTDNLYKLDTFEQFMSNMIQANAEASGDSALAGQAAMFLNCSFYSLMRQRSRAGHDPLPPWLTLRKELVDFIQQHVDETLREQCSAH